jgi:hypothetical protein
MPSTPAPITSCTRNGVCPASVEPISGYGNGWPSGLPHAFTQAARTGFTRDSERGWMLLARRTYGTRPRSSGISESIVPSFDNRDRSLAPRPARPPTTHARDGMPGVPTLWIAVLKPASHDQPVPDTKPDFSQSVGTQIGVNQQRKKKEPWGTWGSLGQGSDHHHLPLCAVVPAAAVADQTAPFQRALSRAVA